MEIPRVTAAPDSPDSSLTNLSLPDGVDRQVALLQAGVELVRRVGTAAALHLVIYPEYVPGFHQSLSVQVTSGTAKGTDIDKDRAPLVGIAAVADVIGGTLALDYDQPDYLSLKIAGISADGVAVDVYTVLHTDEGRADARAIGAALGASEPTRAELDAIESEWPLIAAELAVVDAETAIAAGHTGPWVGPRLVTARRHLAAVAAVIHPADPDVPHPFVAAGLFRRSA